MTDEHEDYPALSPREIGAERAAMSLVNANVAIPTNAVVAANVPSDNATAIANAAQTGAIKQGH